MATDPWQDAPGPGEPPPPWTAGMVYALVFAALSLAFVVLMILILAAR